MNQNPLIEFGSKVDIILRFKANTSINGKSYSANEPYLFLRNVSAIIEYGNNEKIASVLPKNEIAYSNIRPSSISITNVDFTKKIASLLSCFVENNVAFNPTQFEEGIATKNSEEEGGVVLLKNQAATSNNLIVYDADFNKLTATYNSELNAVESPEFEDGENYLISFSSESFGTKFNLIKPYIPYMSIEIQGIGNINKQSKNMMAFFSKVSLSSVLNLDFIYNSAINIPLTFVILSDENYIVFED